MSLCLIYAFHNRFEVAVDTALSCINSNTGEVKRCREEIEKLSFVTKHDTVFISGMHPMINVARKMCYDFVEGDYINIDRLQKALKAKYPLKNNKLAKYSCFELDIAIFRIKDNRAYIFNLAQVFDYKVGILSQSVDSTSLYTTGTKQDESNVIAMEYIKKGYPAEFVFTKTFSDVSCEGVGGSYRIYELNKNGQRLILKGNIIEKDILYATEEENREVLLQSELQESDKAGSLIGGNININNKFRVDENGNAVLNSANVSGNITGSQIEGSNIKGNNIEGGTINATYIYGSDIQGTTITGGTITGATLNTNGGAFSVDSSGVLHANKATFGSGSTTMSLDNNGFTTYQDGVQKTNLYINGLTTDIIAAKAISVYDSYGRGGSVLTTNDASNFAPSSHYHGTLYSNSSSSGRTVYISSNTNFVCPDNGDLGTSSNPWISVRANNVYNSGGLITSSDERKKNTIEPLNNKYSLLFDKLNPVSYKYNEGTSGRTHLGLIAQEVEQSINDVGLTDKECAILVKDPVYSEMNEDGSYDETSEVVDYDYSIRYNELIPMLINEIKDLKNETKELKLKVKNLEQQS